jgi:hypothetical protein
MMKGHTMTQPKRVLRRIGKFLGYTVALAVVVLATVHFAWKYSGSSQWELWRDKKGVAIYTMKVPGATRLQFKVVTRLRTTMDRAVAGLTDTSTEGCQHFVTGCISGTVFKPFDEQSLSYTQLYRISYEPRLIPKDLAFVNKVQLARDPRTKTVTATLDAVPELIPNDDCCIHMTELHNVWRFTPVGNGMIELVYTENDHPPYLPYWVYNRSLRRNHTWMRRNAEEAFNKEKYKNARFAFLREPAMEMASSVEP